VHPFGDSFLQLKKTGELKKRKKKKRKERAISQPVQKSIQNGSKTLM
jgi:hypothetical protein